jgi:hypothetical protein
MHNNPGTGVGISRNKESKLLAGLSNVFSYVRVVVVYYRGLLRTRLLGSDRYCTVLVALAT